VRSISGATAPLKGHVATKNGERTRRRRGHLPSLARRRR
jgi:hypothetical protein